MEERRRPSWRSARNMLVVLLVTALGIVSSGSDGCGPVPPSSHTSSVPGYSIPTLPAGRGTLVWSGGFTDPTWKTQWNVQSGRDFGWPNATVVSDPTFGSVLRVSYPAGSASPAVSASTGAPLGGLQFVATPVSSVDAIHLSYHVRFASTFTWVKGGKLPGLYGGTVISGLTVPDGTNGFSTRYMWRTGGAGEIFALLPTTTTTGGTSLGRGSWTFVQNRWYLLEQEIILNTPGASDGVVRVWVDGMPIFEVSGLEFRTVATLKIDGIFFSTFFGGDDPTWATPVDTWADFADFSLRE